jgi:hypothetical protein
MTRLLRLSRPEGLAHAVATRAVRLAPGAVYRHVIRYSFARTP